MAKKQPKGRPVVTERRELIFNLKGVSAYKEWLVGLAGHTQLSISETVGRALKVYAETEGYTPPPKR